MKTILQALRDEIPYPLDEGHIENRLLARGLDPGAEADPSLYSSPPFLGAMADAFYRSALAPDFSESDISVKKPDPKLLLREANRLYAMIGEPERFIDNPTVRVGPDPDAYVRY